MHETSQHFTPTLPMQWYSKGTTAAQQYAKKESALQKKVEGTIDQDVNLLTNQGIFCICNCNCLCIGICWYEQVYLYWLLLCDCILLCNRVHVQTTINFFG